MTKDSTPLNAKWKGNTVYRCRLCPFDTLDKAVFEDHFAKVHAPMQVIEGRRNRALNLNALTRAELNTHAEDYGVEDAVTYANKADVIAAMDAVQKEGQ